jgi:hypothetical protein
MFLLSTENTELTWMWSIPSKGTARAEVFRSLAVLVVVLLMRRLLMRVFSVGLRSSVYPWAEAGPLKGPRSRWTGIPRYLEHRHLAFLSTALDVIKKYNLGALIARRLAARGPIYGGIIAARIVAALGLSVAPNDTLLVP